MDPDEIFDGKRLSEWIQPDVLQELIAYRDQRIQPSGSVANILENDLVGAAGVPDPKFRGAIAYMALWCYWHLPSRAWRSREAVDRWLGNCTHLAEKK